MASDLYSSTKLSKRTLFANNWGVSSSLSTTLAVFWYPVSEYTELTEVHRPFKHNVYIHEEFLLIILLN